MQPSLNFDPCSLPRLLDLEEILVGRNTLADRTYWPTDVVAAVYTRATEISTVLGGTELSQVTHDQLSDLDRDALWQIWSLLPCPWCGRHDSHDNLRALTSAELDTLPCGQDKNAFHLAMACPLRASEENFEAALAQWQIARRNEWHNTYYPIDAATMHLAPYHNMGHHRERVDATIGGFSALFPAPEHQFVLCLGIDQGRLNGRAMELLASGLVPEAVEGLLESLREELGKRAELPPPS